MVWYGRPGLQARRHSNDAATADHVVACNTATAPEAADSARAPVQCLTMRASFLLALSEGTAATRDPRPCASQSRELPLMPVTPSLSSCSSTPFLPPAALARWL